MFNAKKMPTKTMSASETIDLRLDKCRRDLQGATNAAAIRAVTDSVQTIVNDIDDLVDGIADEIRQEADNIDRSRTKELFAQKVTMQQLLTEAEGLRAKAEEKEQAALRQEEDAAAKAKAAELKMLLQEQRRLILDMAKASLVLLEQVDRYAAVQNEGLKIRDLLRTGMKRPDLIPEPVFKQEEIEGIWSGVAGDTFHHFVNNHKDLSAVHAFLALLSSRMQ